MDSPVPEAVQAGGILVNMKFETFLLKFLKSLGLSSECLEDFATAGVEDFENFAKRNFGDSDSDGPSVISDHVSIRVANTGSYGTTQTKIHRGCLKVPRCVLA
jgi:hypothetical protein